MRCIELQKRSDVALVTSSSSEALTELGDRPGADMTARLLLALTALYVQRPIHTVEEQQQYIELALRLIDKVEAATQAAIACILQQHPDAPAEVVERLAPCLSSSACGGEKGRRRDGDPDGEPHSTRDRHSAGDEPAARDPHLADGECASTIVQGCGDEVQAPTEDTERRYRRIDAAALHGRIDEFSREFERLIDIPKGLCERILDDPSGEPLVVAAKAAGMPIAILQHILLVGLSVSHSVQRVYGLTELYHGLDGGAARDLLARWRVQAQPDDPVPETGPNTQDRGPDSSRNPPVASLRSRFSALTERVQSQAVNTRLDRGNAVRRGLRSR
jgi:hypothetical protein